MVGENLSKEDKEFMEKNKLADKFTQERTQRCIDLMRPEIRAMINWPLEKKIKKSQEIIRQAFKKYKNVGVGFSGGADSEVLLHMILKIKHDIPILFVDTGYEFPETPGFIEKLRTAWNFETFTTVRAGKDRVGRWGVLMGVDDCGMLKAKCVSA